ncbi:MAG TPA: hypothetical protein VEI96_04735 [Thermodesulfovibrionales bacterium]|nr:hypothetical protein [Thermodesulfovibrionales bacterium]
MKKVLFFLIAFTIVISFLHTRNALAAIYKYVDHNGTICFCDNLYSIPEKYRKSAVIVKNDSERLDKQSPEQKSGEADSGVPGPDKRDAYIGKQTVKDVVRNVREGRLLHSIVVFIGFLAVFIGIGKAANSLNRKRLGTVLRFILTLGVIVYLFFAYSRELSDTYAVMKEELSDAKILIEEKNKKADEVVKESSERPIVLK